MKTEILQDDNYYTDGSLLRITWDTEEVTEYYDSMEYEDVSFYRGLDWISDCIERAYYEGKLAGLREAKDIINND